MKLIHSSGEINLKASSCKITGQEATAMELPPSLIGIKLTLFCNNS